MEFGKTLREAREAKGYTIAQLAEMTHIMSRTIEGMEAEDFSSIPAPIYGRGFVKLCCQQLDLEQQPMVEEFMAIFTGEKPAAKAAAIPAAAPAAPVVQPEPEPAPATPVAETPAPAVPQEPIAAPEPPPPPQSSFGELFNQTPEPPPRNESSRFAPPKPIDIEGSPRLPFSLPVIPWRLVLLAIVAITILWGVIAGAKAVYRALSTPSEEPAVVESTTPSHSGSAAKVPRTPKPVKPLYID